MEIGADIINDVSGGLFDERMVNIVKRYDCPYILMHSRGLPQNMLEKRFLDYGNDFIGVLLKEINEKVIVFRSHKVLE